VAVKVVGRELAPAALRRVQEEQRILARLEHPGIARLYDAGVTSLGRPYLAMEYVQGETIVEHCRSRQLPLRERLELFLGSGGGLRHHRRHPRRPTSWSRARRAKLRLRHRQPSPL
jgi:serine/threonine-protein kinase